MDESLASMWTTRILATTVMGACTWFVLADLEPGGQIHDPPPLTFGAPLPSRASRPAKLAAALEAAATAPEVRTRHRRGSAGMGGGGDGEAAHVGAEAVEVQISVWPADADGIRAAIRDRTPRIEACYDGWLQVPPDLGGRVEVTFELQPSDTAVELAHIVRADIASSDAEHAVMEGCVLSAVEDLRFEHPPEGGLVVDYPFVFEPGG